MPASYLPSNSGHGRYRRARPVWLVVGLLLSIMAVTACRQAEQDQHKKTDATLIIQLGDDPRLGAATAPLGLLEFADYQCPHCQRFHVEVLPALKKTYIDTGLVQYIYKDFPLKTQRMAFSASLAANCAGQQDQYWRMQDELFAHQTRLSLKLFDELAKQLALEPETFSACMRQSDNLQEVYADLQYGLDLGVRSTPSFFLGRIHQNTLIVTGFADGTPSFAELQEEIEALRACADNEPGCSQ